jgi:hypothetical protein
VTSKELYKLFLIDYNKLDRNSEVEVSKADFVMMFNREQRAFIEETVPPHNSGQEIQDLRDIMVPYEKLKSVQIKSFYTEFTLPETFFRSINSYSICEKDSCKNIPVANSFKNIKPQDVQELLNDPRQGPSFEFQETLVTFMGKRMQVYHNDFQIKEQYVSFYKYPRNIDIAGSRKANGELSTDIDPELDVPLLEKIISRVVKTVSGIYSNAEQFQVSQEKIQRES